MPKGVTNAPQAMKAARLSLILADTLIITLTWWKLFRQIVSGKLIRARRGNMTLADIFLQDGEYLTTLNTYSLRSLTLRRDHLFCVSSLTP